MAPVLWVAAASALGALLSGCGSPPAPAPTPAPTPAPATPMPDLVSVEQMMGTLRSLQDIASGNGGSREATGPGGNATVDFIISEIARITGGALQPQRQTLFQNRWTAGDAVLVQTSPVERTFEKGTDFLELPGSPGTTVEANVTFVEGGCSPLDWANFPEGNIALLAEQPLAPPFCFPVVQLLFAGKAAGVIIYARQGEGLKMAIPWSESFGIPTSFLMTYEAAQDLLSGDVKARMESTSRVEQLELSNVILDIPGENTEAVLVVGAHSDSWYTTACPGINDDGSGTAVVLELLRTFGERFGFSGNAALKHTLRLGWWTAEEKGLMGSGYYVSSLSEEEKRQIVGYLNFDMMASPNGKNGIALGSDDANANASTYMQTAFQEGFAVFGENFTLASSVDLGGASDHTSFRNGNIPASFIFAGAAKIKTEEEALMFGGTAGVPYDSCYHQACDNIDNVDQARFLLFGRVAATVVERFLLDADLSEHLTRDATVAQFATATPPTAKPDGAQLAAAAVAEQLHQTISGYVVV